MADPNNPLTPRLNEVEQKTSANYLINGNFDFNQRGNVVGTSATLNYIGPDRFLMSRQGSWFVSPVFDRFEDSPNSKTKYCWRTYNSEAGDALAYEEVEQRIESIFARDLINQKVSFSVKYKFQSYQRIKLEIFTADVEDNFSSVTLVHSEEQVVTNDFTWRDFKVENKLLGINAKNGVSVKLTLSEPSIIGSGSPYESRLTQMKLNIGEVATDFQRAGRDYTEELQLCQRYFHAKIFGFSYYNIAMYRDFGSPGGGVTFFIPTRMRVDPYVSISGSPVLLVFTNTQSSTITSINGIGTQLGGNQVMVAVNLSVEISGTGISVDKTTGSGAIWFDAEM